MSDYYSVDQCSNEARVFLLCMKKPVQDNKCKDLFDSWYKCINRDQFTKLKQTDIEQSRTQSTYKWGGISDLSSSVRGYIPQMFFRLRGSIKDISENRSFPNSSSLM